MINREIFINISQIHLLISEYYPIKREGAYRNTSPKADRFEHKMLG